MLNGQLPLTALYLPQVSIARLSRRSLWAVGAIGLGLLAGCASPTSRAPVVDLSTQPAVSSATSSGGTYVVKPGDTLYKIARGNNVTIADLKQWNSIGDANQLAVGQILKLGAVATASASPSATPVATPTAVIPPASTTAPTSTPAPATTTTPPASTTTPASSVPAAPASVARAADANLISWGWPASGPIIQTFTPATKGIDLGGGLGAPVLAAADGKVMYSGNGVRGLGNLIIVNHDNGFITAYAHNQTLLVKTGGTVKRGAKIAEIGQSDTTSPRLHFEIRRQGTPVDPLQYLPAR